MYTATEGSCRVGQPFVCIAFEVFEIFEKPTDRVHVYCYRSV